MTRCSSYITGTLRNAVRSESGGLSAPAPEGIRGLHSWHLIHQNGQFVRTDSSGFVPTVPFSKFMKTQMLPQFQCNFAWRQWLSFLSASIKGEAGPVKHHYRNGTTATFPISKAGGREVRRSTWHESLPLFGGPSTHSWLSAKFTTVSTLGVKWTLNRGNKAMLRNFVF